MGPGSPGVLIPFWYLVQCVYLLQLLPENTEEYVEYLISIGRLDEAAVKMADIVNDVSRMEGVPVATLISLCVSCRTSLSQRRGSRSISCGRTCVF